MEVEQVASDLRRFQALVLSSQGALDLLGDSRLGQDPLVRRGGGVVAVVADRPADHRPVLLLHMRPVVLPSRPGAGEGDLLLGAVPQQVAIDELPIRCRSRSR